MTETSKSERQPVGFPVPDWTAPPHPPRTPMAGQWCRVEPLESARHAVDLFAALEADRDGANGPTSRMAALLGSRTTLPG